ncbi:hypothetical protein ACFUJR_11415 [Streptomyces sp. NPDC057271]|uniref:hypothetical protein n=1 Tax=unclassified Streptomyces TaxID=2593676 RepID=UPI00363EB1FB
MQISDTVTYVDGGSRTEVAAQDHPLGEVTLGLSGVLGLRSRLLRTPDRSTDGAVDVAFTTGTFTLS